MEECIRALTCLSGTVCHPFENRIHLDRNCRICFSFFGCEMHSPLGGEGPKRNYSESRRKRAAILRTCCASGERERLYKKSVTRMVTRSNTERVQGSSERLGVMDVMRSKTPSVRPGQISEANVILISKPVGVRNRRVFETSTANRRITGVWFACYTMDFTARWRQWGEKSL